MELPLNRVILGDCVDEMSKLPARSINTVLTDPPYFIIGHYGSFRKRRPKKFSDLSIPIRFFKDVFQEAARVLKPDGHLLVFCDPYTYPLMYQAPYN